MTFATNGIVRVRRFSSDTVHLADVPEVMTAEASFLGVACTVVEPPVATTCLARLRGEVVVMDPEQSRVRCSRCRTWANARGIETGRLGGES